MDAVRAVETVDDRYERTDRFVGSELTGPTVLGVFGYVLTKLPDRELFGYASATVGKIALTVAVVAAVVIIFRELAVLRRMSGRTTPRSSTMLDRGQGLRRPSAPAPITVDGSPAE